MEVLDKQIWLIEIRPGFISLHFYGKLLEQRILKLLMKLLPSRASMFLGAMPLNSDLTASLPVVQNGIVVNNVMDIGEKRILANKISRILLFWWRSNKI
jgi:hypothetical protein